MPRKSADSLRSVNMARAEEFALKADYLGRVAREVYEAQDEKTQEVIERIRKVLVAHCNGTIYGPGTIEDLDMGMEDMLWHLAVEAAKDLGILGIRVGTFTFPDNLCAVCGGEV